MATVREVTGKTPNGGVKAVLQFVDPDGEPVEEDAATNVVINELDESGSIVFTTYGTTNGSKGSTQ